MCWSAEASLNTFLFATFGLVYGLTNNYNWRILLFIYCYSAMQFVEYNLWKNLSDKKANEFWSKAGYALILLEPLFAINIVSNFDLRAALAALYIIYIALMEHKQDFNTTIGPNRHLAWNWIEFPTIFWIVWLSFFGLPFLIEKLYVWWLLGSLTFVGSYYYYAKDKTFGSMWCWIVTAGWLLVIGDSSGLTHFTK